MNEFDLTTHFHLGPALVLALVLYRWLDFPTLLAASIVPDIRAILIFFGVLSGDYHGVLQTFIGALLLSVVLSAGMYAAKPYVNVVLEPFRLAQERSVRAVGVGAVVGSFSHIVLDSLVWRDVQPFYPFDFNPFLGHVSLLAVYAFCTLCIVVGTGGYVYMFSTSRLDEHQQKL
ncbi:MAG: hypothetical protein SXQ77_05685 [Halobacteria archaeon]|nr:hypothetical protein [Halobacteria archaeon]